MRPPPNLSQHQPGSRARHGGSVAAAGLVQGGTIKPIPGRKNHKVELNTVVNYKQYVLKMMVFRQIPNLILINWMQDFDQHEKNRKTAPPATTASSRQEKGGRGRAERDFLLQKKKCGFPGTCVLKWIEMECELKKYLETEVIVTFLCLAVHGVFLANT
ncbi:uncharacterized protein LOC129125855 isoform X3 [Agelaius phoeniceus]|uniref:uncharacterized protein LOC129125855 isoform X3 n=1 Tax=Agelaius phoeniceus TaxID=39638 RepID=UPI0040550548